MKQYWWVFWICPPFLKMERRQVLGQNLSRVYRQFSRQRYNKYKHQFPRMRQAEIVLKIIKEWERMDHAQKMHLSQRYQHQHYIPHDEEQSNSHLASPLKTPFKPSSDLPVPSTLKTKSTSFQSKPKQLLPYHQEESEFNRHSEKPSQEVKSDRSSYSLMVVHSSSSRQEKAGLPKNHHYIVFYKHHYRKLTREHPRWSATKVSQIIKLLWLRRQRVLKKSQSKKIAKVPKQRPIKTLTGRALFFKIKASEGYSSPQIRLKWNKQPCETKQFFHKWGQGEPTATTLRPQSSTLLLRPEVVSFSSGSQNLKFMHNKVKFD